MFNRSASSNGSYGGPFHPLSSCPRTTVRALSVMTSTGSRPPANASTEGFVQIGVLVSRRTEADGGIGHHGQEASTRDAIRYYGRQRSQINFVYADSGAHGNAEGSVTDLWRSLREATASRQESFRRLREWRPHAHRTHPISSYLGRRDGGRPRPRRNELQAHRIDHALRRRGSRSSRARRQGAAGDGRRTASVEATEQARDQLSDLARRYRHGTYFAVPRSQTSS